MRTPTFSRAFGAILRRRRAKGAPPTRRALFEPLEARELLDVAGGVLRVADLSSRPTLVGRIASTGSVAGITINVYSVGVLVGQTTTDASGAFEVRPVGLTYGSQTLSCAARVWNATTRAYVEGTTASVSFTYVPPTVAAPTLDELRLWDDTGVANDTITSNAAIAATSAYGSALIVSTATGKNRTKASDEAEVDARVAYYVACETADYDEGIAKLTARTDSQTRKLDLLNVWSNYVLDKNWTYDTIMYGGYDGLTYSMITPNHSYNITYAVFSGTAPTSLPSALTVDSSAIWGFGTSIPTTLAALNLQTNRLMWQGYNQTTLWKSFYSLDAAFADFRSDFFDASDDFDAEWFQLSRVLAHLQTRIDSGLSVASDAFTNPTFDFEVCFVAGTPVLMADGTKKPIEEIKPGDLVLAADHLDPEGKPQPTRVARFFDNGLKEVVRLRFANGEELTCTPSHPFYICGRGWVKACELRDGDRCLTAEGERVAFSARERVEGERRVYNFEVEGRHTYFVGDRCSILAHNVCPICGRNHTNNYKGISRIQHDTEEVIIYPQESVDLFKSNLQYLKDYYGRNVTIEEIHNPQFIGLSEIEIASVKSQLNNSEFRHYIERTSANDYDQFLYFDLNALSDPEDKIFRDNGGKVKAYFAGDEWDLMADGGSKYHSINGLGFDCFKWCTKGGRELVIRSNHLLEIERTRIGTYNFSNPDRIAKFLSHFIKDMIPYYEYDNFLPDERISELGQRDIHYFMDRIYSIQNNNPFEFLQY